MLETVQNTNHIINENDNGNIRSLIGALVRDLQCEDVFIFLNEDNDIGTIEIGVNDYSVNTVKYAIKKIENDLVDGYSASYDMETEDVNLLKDLLDNIVYLNKTNRNGGNATLELA